MARRSWWNNATRSEKTRGGKARKSNRKWSRRGGSTPLRLFLRGRNLAVFYAGLYVGVCGFDEVAEECGVGGGAGFEFYVAHKFAGAL